VAQARISSLAGPHSISVTCLTRPAPAAFTCLRLECGTGNQGGRGALLQHASSRDAAVPDPSRRNPLPVPWDWIDIGPDDQTLRIEFLEGVVHGLHHIEIDEDDGVFRRPSSLESIPTFTARRHSSGSLGGRLPRPTVPSRVGASATAPRFSGSPRQSHIRSRNVTDAATLGPRQMSSEKPRSASAAEWPPRTPQLSSVGSRITTETSVGPMAISPSLWTRVR
jgi:hypothetical protein